MPSQEFIMKNLPVFAASCALLISACTNEETVPTETDAPPEESARVTELEAEVSAYEQRFAAVEVYFEEMEASLARADGLIVNSARRCQTPADVSILVADAPEADTDDVAATNAAASTAYLDTVRGEACVFELPSGLLFRIRQASDDGDSPASGDMVTVHYRGLFPHGGEFDSSFSRGEPATFPSDRLIQGWVEALPLMRIGESWELYIAAEMAYGTNPRPGGPIGPNQALVFTLDLIDLP
jgi:FKBP-type peptidyl-prolyl cis-trans isomerase FklB